MSGSNTGDQDLTDYVKIIAKEASQGANITGTVAETILYSKLIPANTLKDGDFMNLFSRVAKIGTLGTLTQKISVNTSNTLSGATLLATNNTTAANRLASLTRIFSLSEGLITGISTGLSINSDIVNNNNNPVSQSFNPTIDNYIFITGQLSNSADTMYHLGTKITN